MVLGGRTWGCMSGISSCSRIGVVPRFEIRRVWFLNPLESLWSRSGYL